jgi:hypothetical protein
MGKLALKELEMIIRIHNKECKLTGEASSKNTLLLWLLRNRVLPRARIRNFLDEYRSHNYEDYSKMIEDLGNKFYKKDKQDGTD